MINLVAMEVRLGKDPVLRYTASGSAVCNLDTPAGSGLYAGEIWQKQPASTSLRVATSTWLAIFKPVTGQATTGSSDTSQRSVPEKSRSSIRKELR